MSVYGNATGGFGFPKTFMLTDEDGNEIVAGVVTKQEAVFTANPAEDIREGKVAATGDGVVTGSAIIPNYETTEGYQIIPAGSAFSIMLSYRECYDYTRLQVIICDYNNSILDSVSTEKVSIEDMVFEVGSTTSLSTVIKDSETKSINLGISNDTDKNKIMRYFTYKEIL